MQVAKGEPSLNITQELLDNLNSSQDLTSGGLLQLAHIIPDILNLHQVLTIFTGKIAMLYDIMRF
jgi:hypothetical protein